MKNKLDDATWIFVIVQDPGVNEQFFGLHDEKLKISYTPAFHNKNAALSCLIHLPTQRDKKYEVQAVMYGDLSRDASANNFLIFMLDEDGKILEKIFPGKPITPVH